MNLPREENPFVLRLDSLEREEECSWNIPDEDAVVNVWDEQCLEEGVVKTPVPEFRNKGSKIQGRRYALSNLEVWRMGIYSGEFVGFKVI